MPELAVIENRQSLPDGGREPALAAKLRDHFGCDFALLGPDSEWEFRGSRPLPAYVDCGAMAQAALDNEDPRIVDCRAGLALLALPTRLGKSALRTGLAVFVLAEDEPCPLEAADWLGLEADAAARWLQNQERWTEPALLRMARTVQRQLADEHRAAQLEVEIEQMSDSLASTYEEISVLHGLTQNLRISSTDTELGRFALDWLIDVLPAQGMAIQYLPVADTDSVEHPTRTESVLLTSGRCPLNNVQFSHLIEHLSVTGHSGPYVFNQGAVVDEGWPFAEVRQLIVTPLSEGDNIFGWLAAFNHHEGDEFGTVEASLLSSVGAILGIHCGNLELYRHQAEFVASVVRALTSSIDAKDPYTCGHSDRVARIAVRLAEELDCPAETLETIYMAGLLHDIGKIGIDDRVLRKPGRLTPAEFEHLKMHPELGYNILADMRQLSDVLPVVLHHHEAWDGSGYPHKLKGEAIPSLARIAAVADAYDAMTSDRPYRKGMPEERVDEIFRAGAGHQWDPRVIDAFFRARDDIRNIAATERADHPVRLVKRNT